MAATLRVVRSDAWTHPAFDARIATDPRIALSVFPSDADSPLAWDALSQAHVYHIAATKDELPKPLWGHAELIARCPKLLCISSKGAGYDTVNVADCTRAGVAVVNQAGGNAVSVAEHTLGLMLGVSRKMIECDRRMRRERGFPREEVMGHEISGKTIGLVGIGEVGRRVAALAKAFGMNVLAHDPFVTADVIAKRGARPVTLDELLTASDFVSLHCPRDATSLKMIDATAFGKMKPGAIIITTARGGIHDEAALTDALQSGHLAGAGLDVWDIEPPPLDHPLLARDNVYATFHTAGVTHEARANMSTIAADQIIALLSGERPPRLINPEVWPAFVTRRDKILGVLVSPSPSGRGPG